MAENGGRRAYRFGPFQLDVRERRLSHGSVAIPLRLKVFDTLLVLVENAGLNSGFMLAQVTAAALVSENKTLVHPASVDSIPTSADKEDHVSMGMWAALKARQVALNVRRVLAIELLAAAQGLDLLRPLRSSRALEALHAAVRERVARWTEDRQFSPDLAASEAFLAAGVDPHLADLS